MAHKKGTRKYLEKKLNLVEGEKETRKKNDHNNMVLIALHVESSMAISHVLNLLMAVTSVEPQTTR